AFPPSGIILRQGDVGDAFFVVASGTVGVYVTGKSGAVETRLRTLHPGEPFGEMALLGNSPRTATIKAETNCEGLRLERSAFLDLVGDNRTVALAVAAPLSRRLADLLNRSAELEPPAASTAPPPPLEGAVVAAAAAAARPWWRPGRVGIAVAAAIGILGAGWV